MVHWWACCAEDEGPPPWQFWVACVLEPIYLYAVLVATFGCVHCALMCLDVSSKDCVQQGCCTCNEQVCTRNGLRCNAHMHAMLCANPSVGAALALAEKSRLVNRTPLQ